jgi:hypothetical protein
VYKGLLYWLPWWLGFAAGYSSPDIGLVTDISIVLT